MELQALPSLKGLSLSSQDHQRWESMEMFSANLSKTSFSQMK
jgi:hypothetical protein